jgi:hypothetical protein
MTIELALKFKNKFCLMYVPKSRGILFQNRGLILGPLNITTGGCASKEGFLVALAAAAAPAVIFFLKQMTIEFALKLKKKKKKKKKKFF